MCDKPIIYIFKCSRCGSLVELCEYKSNRMYYGIMAKEKLCFECAYWEQTIKELEGNGNVILASGVLYIAPPLKGKREINRCLRRDDGVYFVNTYTNEVTVSRDYSIIGRVPKKFHDKFSSEYKRITKKAARSLIDYRSNFCLRKGCYDRYRCLFYDKELAEGDTPWNTIPSNYVYGSEDCPSFLDRNEAFVE